MLVEEVGESVGGRSDGDGTRQQAPTTIGNGLR